MRRHLLGAVALAALVALAGCGGVFGGIPDEQLCEDATYQWDTDAAATYNVTGDEYQAVMAVNGSEIQLYRNDGLGNERPLQIRAVKFRAADGTVYDCDDIEVSTGQRRTTLELPAEEGQLAFTAGATPKRFSTLTFVEGSHEVVLPPNREVSNPVFGNVAPGGAEVDRSGERLRIRWEEVQSESIVVQYYMERDITLFVGLLGAAGLAAGGGLLYYYRLIQRLRQRREEAGLDVDTEDDEFRDEPPPGMR